MDDSFSEVRQLVIRNSKANDEEKKENNVLMMKRSNPNFNDKAKQLGLRVITRNITESKTSQEDVSILKKGSEKLKVNIKVLNHLLTRVEQQLDIYKTIHKIGGFRKNKSKKRKYKTNYASLKL